jgi:serine/threonine protein kinase
MTDQAVHDDAGDYDRYHILNEIGRGSFAPVYRAWDEVDQKYVAVKLFNLEVGK